MAAALALAPAGYSMTLLTAARVVADGADAAYFTRIVPTSQRAKVSGVAIGWATLELVVAWLGNRRR